MGGPAGCKIVGAGGNRRCVARQPPILNGRHFADLRLNGVAAAHIIP
jgi:hypothetical protein